MAILLSYLPLLDACHRQQGIVSPLVALGSQQLPETPAQLIAWAGERGYPHMAAAPSAATLFRDRYGVAEYRDVDLNDDAAIRLDLSAPLPPELHGTAGTVLDGGTIEHIADVRTVLENIHLLLRPGGTFIGFLPVGWWEHGFFNLNPRLFRATAAANGWEPLAEGLWFRVGLPVLGTRFITVVTREGEVRPRAKLWTDRLLNRAVPGRTTYCCCYRKVGDAPFAVPSDVFGNW